MEKLTHALVARAVESFHGRHVLVVGDVMLDEFLLGDVARISPEAPVPVLDFTERRFTPGGAANAAANIVSLGGRATIISAVGADAQGESLRAAMNARGIDTASLVTDPQRPTTHKLRVVARTQQIVRVDVESRAPIDAAMERALSDLVAEQAAHADAIVVSDYAKGVVTDALLRACVSAAKGRSIPLVVDPKSRDFGRYAGATMITPNVLELDLAAGVSTHNADAAVVDAVRALLPKVGGASILVTRGAAGMTLVAPDGRPFHLPTLARAVFDVTGAGDSVVGTLTLALAAKVPVEQALVLAARAAGIAVGQPGTVAVTAKELLASFEDVTA